LDEDIEATCDRVGILTGGRIAYDGSTSELIRRASGS
jgi:ABC-type multidrug transport system ATPase subunit